MAHEIEQNDNVGVMREKAWHGLGTVWQDAKTPVEALEELGMDYTVEQWGLVAKSPNPSQQQMWKSDRIDSRYVNTIPCSQVANVRTDVNKVLGIVTPHYEIVQNRQLAEFCEALAEQDDRVTVESAGTIRNGAKVWFLLKGESFSVRDTDELVPYILVSNGFDGKTSLRCTPTTIRVVCANTLHMVVPEKADSKQPMKIAGYTTKHIGNLEAKIEEAKTALKLYGRSLETNKLIIGSLAAKDVSTKAIEQFFLECYTRDFGGIPETPTTKREHNKRNKAMDACVQFSNRFERERDVAGATAWNAMNSYTGWLQNDREVWLKDPAKAEESRLGSVLFGTNAERGLRTMQLALAM